MLFAKFALTVAAAVASVRGSPVGIGVKAPSESLPIAATTIDVLASPTATEAFIYHPGQNASDNGAARLSAVKQCGDSTFTDQTSAASPLAADCLQIAANIVDEGTWTVFDGFRHQLVQYGTCAFSVRGMDGFILERFRLGNEDICDIINAAVGKFQSESGPNGEMVIGALGYVSCPHVTFGGLEQVLWGIYHT
ncbi:putative necrosis-inducing factor-domain-containing protein [Podospora appendiculata]|uniref:Necrosis-inducing factor-domain-containing protein n=1 Tax=Podospora appendiculata TaxID=314037 RepID=A0AAE0XAB9_9PEZI|nr:putative necrosis-inducing factor-domain-containing protein [Podospora appendiculata]